MWIRESMTLRCPVSFPPSPNDSRISQWSLSDQMCERPLESERARPFTRSSVKWLCSCSESIRQVSVCLIWPRPSPLWSCHVRTCEAFSDPDFNNLYRLFFSLIFLKFRLHCRLYLQYSGVELQMKNPDSRFQILLFLNSSSFGLAFLIHSAFIAAYCPLKSIFVSYPNLDTWIVDLPLSSPIVFYRSRRMVSALLLLVLQALAATSNGRLNAIQLLKKDLQMLNCLIFRRGCDQADLSGASGVYERVGNSGIVLLNYGIQPSAIWVYPSRFIWVSLRLCKVEECCSLIPGVCVGANK